MNRKKFIIPILCLLVTVFFGLTYFGDDNSQDNEYDTELKKYKEDIKDFNELTAKEALAKIDDNESFFLYLGRDSCPYCREFAPSLDKKSKEKNITINYVDTEDAGTDLNIDSLIERYDVEFVPTLIYLSEYGNDVKFFNEKEELLGNFLDRDTGEN